MNIETESTFFDGRCTCRFVRYRMTTSPLFVHCCHCRWCQRETGASFALNALIEADRVQLLQGEVEVINTPSASGKGQKISRCPRCRIAVWSNYAGAGDAVRFIRIGTLDEPDRLPPDIHIYTASKQPWVILPPDMPAVAESTEHPKGGPRKALNAEPPPYWHSPNRSSPNVPTPENLTMIEPSDITTHPLSLLNLAQPKRRSRGTGTIETIRACMLAVFQFLAVLCCILFAGAAIYINLVEHPQESARHQDCGDV